MRLSHWREWVAVKMIVRKETMKEAIVKVSYTAKGRLVLHSRWSNLPPSL
jgi:hypothetical protein